MPRNLVLANCGLLALNPLPKQLTHHRPFIMFLTEFFEVELPLQPKPERDQLYFFPKSFRRIMRVRTYMSHEHAHRGSEKRKPHSFRRDISTF
jgi:hypothetical protein